MAENYCYIKDGVITRVQPLPKSWANCSGGFHLKGDAELKTYGWLPMVEVHNAYDQSTHYLDPVDVDIQSNQVVYTDVVVAFTSQQLKQNKDNDWKSSMILSDIGMSRVIEDILDGMADKSGVNQITLARLKSKKDLRATKP